MDNLVNSLENHEEILLIRLFQKIISFNLRDIQHIFSNEEKEELDK
jgi:hypothetical protein